ncbi:NADPH:quinone oxidoreductase family protein [Mycolicibacterium smegmatis]|uniref:NADPH quinone oxidoreductase FadB4 n=3 Tax=Mycolicibacterium smegmatis TaxID=1772 RepID=I7FI49_MYCS2|nr:NADPH:quinone oxidoreductase family protein [Mycolicibacterium smegmatis]ABK73305.1 oxidoreductase, zinc-binding dehydrogenase family protein [Mycolicibacterium smegmatis MC2 155]AFP38458.1 NADPH quinone oxidoreductase FadB4 [Mycolicibacterium smegmatis MC2 155]AIU07244.1 NADPH:quinone oxidoreductase [Mycolicibacterium smegmatis MC2 155]AIU13869.1 NADPH:quinone oxidoreductase [Mycolicibacterium smegmatis]AIU20493.1 NADPH:quinone oxidoreductase [Mycolicibacterium smegmatis]
MRAALITRLDGPDAVEVVEVDEPSGDDAVLIDVHAAGVAFPDALLTRGLYQYKPDLPFSPGAEVAGVVRSAPAGASVAAGDRVLGLTMLSGGMAEVVALPEDRVFKLPDAVPFDAGAGILFNDMTVHFVLRTRGRLSGGETVLVHGAAGGIGSSVLRLAPALGAARTIAVVSTEEKGEIARAAGASDVVLADGFRDAVKELTDGRGVDMVVDPVGGDRFTDSLRSLAVGGRLLVVGFTGGEIPQVKVNRLLLNNIEVIGAGWGAWTFTHPGYLQEQWAELEPLLASGAVAPPQVEVYPLEQAAQAIASLENRSAKGKVVLKLR